MAQGYSYHLCKWTDRSHDYTGRTPPQHQGKTSGKHVRQRTRRELFGSHTHDTWPNLSTQPHHPSTVQSPQLFNSTTMEKLENFELPVELVSLVNAGLAAFAERAASSIPSATLSCNSLAKGLSMERSLDIR